MTDMPAKVRDIRLGDNLEHLLKLESESIDLIYLDPPYNSSKQYYMTLPGNQAQIDSFLDCFDLDSTHTMWDSFRERSHGHLNLTAVIKYVDLELEVSTNEEDRRRVAYLRNMAVRGAEFHRILKPTGSLFLQCDPTADGYLRVSYDKIFGPGNNRGQVVWRRNSACNNARRYGPIHDDIYHWTKGDGYLWVPTTQEYTDDYIRKSFRYTEPDGRRYRVDNLTGRGKNRVPWREVWPPVGRQWVIQNSLRVEYLARTGTKLDETNIIDALEELDRVGLIYWPEKSGGVPSYKNYLKDGGQVQDFWFDIEGVHNGDFDCEKPKELIRRLMLSTTNEGALVLDPYLGSGTTAVVAEEENRRWIGMELSPATAACANNRIEEECGPCEHSYIEYGRPMDIETFEAIQREDPWELQRVALQDVLRGHCFPRGRDGGLDGLLTYIGHDNRQYLFGASVKGGAVKREFVSDLKTIIDVQTKYANMRLGVFIAFRSKIPPEAWRIAKACGDLDLGVPGAMTRVPLIQIITFEDLIDRSKEFGGLIVPGVLISGPNPEKPLSKRIAKRNREQAASDLRDFLDSLESPVGVTS